MAETIADIIVKEMSGKTKKTQYFDYLDLYDLERKYESDEDFESCPLQDIAEALKKGRQVKAAFTDEVQVAPDEYEGLLVVTLQ